MFGAVFCFLEKKSYKSHYISQTPYYHSLTLDLGIWLPYPPLYWNYSLCTTDIFIHEFIHLFTHLLVIKAGDKIIIQLLIITSTYAISNYPFLTVENNKPPKILVSAMSGILTKQWNCCSKSLRLCSTNPTSLLWLRRVMPTGPPFKPFLCLLDTIQPRHWFYFSDYSFSDLLICGIISSYFLKNCSTKNGREFWGRKYRKRRLFLSKISPKS